MTDGEAQEARTTGFSDWFSERIPPAWSDGALEVTVDREEITVVIPLAQSSPDAPEGSAAQGRGLTEAQARSRRFREETRNQRMEIAAQAEQAFRRKVSWGVAVGDHRVFFTTHSVPVMTRLRQPERLVLDTLVDSGVARSRSDALAWCVRLTGEHADSWLRELRSALQRVEQVRAAGPLV